jgi:hypothetical protein
LESKLESILHGALFYFGKTLHFIDVHWEPSGGLEEHHDVINVLAQSCHCYMGKKTQKR